MTQPRPNWVTDNPALERLLHGFIDQLDRGVKAYLKVSASKLPALYDFNHSEQPLLWPLIKKLEADYAILRIEPAKLRINQEPFEGAKLYFQSEQERLVRAWLGRPKQCSPKHVWQQALQVFSWPECCDLAFIASQPLSFEGKSYEQVAKQLHALGVALQEQALKTGAAALDLRTWSARFFWGDSKFLDRRFLDKKFLDNKLLDSHQDYLTQAFPALSAAIKPRPVLLNVYLPEQFDSLLFIENQASYLLLVDSLRESLTVPACLQNKALVYAAGFKGAAQRIRQPEGYALSHSRLCSPQALAHFERNWLQEQGWNQEKGWQQEQDLPCYFWGDLDYSGMSILRALRQVFPSAQAWQPAYAAMLSFLKQGTAHAFTAPNKGEQATLEHTGCRYADEVLLPAIKQCRGFVDQEIIVLDDLRA